MSPVVAATECIPSKKAKASTGLILKTKGIISAKVAAPPIPGSKPTQNPNPMPSIIRLKAFHCRTRKRPSMKASNILGYTTGLDRIRILLLRSSSVGRHISETGE